MWHFRSRSRTRRRRLSESYNPPSSGAAIGEHGSEKITKLHEALEANGLEAGGNAELIQNVLYGRYARGDVARALDMFMMLRDAEDLIVKDVDPATALQGAENMNGLTCYLDSLLFAMYARSTSFDIMLFSSFEDPQRRRLSVLLRLFVNMLRSGKLITTDLIGQLRISIGECGWEDVNNSVQQDSSEAFAFITAALQLPMLALKVKILHGGRGEEDDDKFITERLINLPIPGRVEDSGTPITLEECMASYFSNEIRIRRKVDMAPGFKVRQAFGTDVKAATDAEAADKGDVAEEHDIPAWQFFQLLPFYSSEVADADLNQHFKSQRPMLGICLKRYGRDENGRLVRNSRRVVLPNSIVVPQYIVGEEDVGDGIKRSYRLVLQSAVCHRGNSLSSGHYIALVRDNTSTDADTGWLKFDDMAEKRVVHVADSKSAFKDETPYIVFYQLEEYEAGLSVPGTPKRSRSPIRRAMEEGRRHRDTCPVM